MKRKKYFAPKSELIEFEIEEYCEGPSIGHGDIGGEDDWLEI